MNKPEILAEFETVYRTMARTGHLFNDKDFYKSIDKKWSPAEHMRHLTFSAKVVNKGLKAPKLLLALRFGISLGRPKSYKKIVKAYQNATFPATTGFEPRMKSNSTKSKEIEDFLVAHQNIVDSVYNNWSEMQLNRYQLKHPVLGKISVREFMYFMIHHVVHHTKPLIK